MGLSSDLQTCPLRIPFPFPEANWCWLHPGPVPQLDWWKRLFKQRWLSRPRVLQHGKSWRRGYGKSGAWWSYSGKNLTKMQCMQWRQYSPGSVLKSLLFYRIVKTLIHLNFQIWIATIHSFKMVNNIEGSSCLKQAKTQSHTWQVGCWLKVIVYTCLPCLVFIVLV